MDNYSFSEIMHMALRKEQESARFYRAIANHVRLSGQRQLFSELAEEEGRHEEMLGKLDIDHLPDVSPAAVPDLHLSEYLTEPPVTEDMYYDEILRLAMKREQKSVHLYRHLLGRAPNDQVRTLLQFLAEQEQRHKYRLEREYDDQVLREM